MKGEALQYLGKKEEAENVLETVNTLEPERRRQIEENTGTYYSTKKEYLNYFFIVTVPVWRSQGQTQLGKKKSRSRTS